jgi:putative endonuclease
MLCGYRVHERRWRSPYGEIDVIARRGRTICFIEVKARTNVEEALFALQPRQQQRILRAARAYLAAHPKSAGLEIRFDLMVVAGYRWPRHLRHAFDASDTTA